MKEKKEKLESSVKLRVHTLERLALKERAETEGLSITNYIRKKIGLQLNLYGLRAESLEFDDLCEFRLRLFLRQLAYLRFNREDPHQLIISPSDFIGLKKRLFEINRIQELAIIIAEIKQTIEYDIGFFDHSTYRHNPPAKHFPRSYEGLVELAKQEERFNEYPFPEDFDIGIYSVYPRWQQGEQKVA